MELTLNLAWTVLAGVMVWLWIWSGSCTGTNRRMQIVALAVLLLILFPVISVSDDLLAMQNPAEADSCLRREHVAANAHSAVPAVAALPQPVVADNVIGFMRLAAQGNLPVKILLHPGLGDLDNRPPPAA